MNCYYCHGKGVHWYHTALSQAEVRCSKCKGTGRATCRQCGERMTEMTCTIVSDCCDNCLANMEQEYRSYHTWEY